MIVIAAADTNAHRLAAAVRTAAMALAVAAPALASLGQSVPAGTGDARVDRLLSQMTLKEKLRLIHGMHEDKATYQGQAGYVGGVPRLGIPALRLADGPPGVLTRHPAAGETATMGVAATFSVADAEANGAVIGREARALGIDVTLQPFINIARDPAFSRAYNTFGEDPLLTAQIGAAEVRGIQAQHVMAQAKHYIGYDSDGTNIYIDDQALHEVYLAPFEAAIEAGVSSVMCGYNRIDGAFACGNTDLLTRTLRGELGFKGFVTSDWGAVHAVTFLNAGLDMEMPGEPDRHSASYLIPSFFDEKHGPLFLPRFVLRHIAKEIFGGHLPEEPATPVPAIGDFGLKLDPKRVPAALKDGTITEADVTRAAGRVLYEMNRFGLLDGAPKHDITPQGIEANARVIEKTAEDAAILLKNQDQTLPLKASDLDSVVLIGPTAAQVDAIGISGERSLGLVEREIGPLEAMRRIAGHAHIAFAVADDMTGTPIPASALTHGGKPGLERRTRIGRHIDRELNFTVGGGNALAPNTRATWKGELTVPHEGSYWIYLQALGVNAQIKIDGTRLAATGAFQGGVHGDILQPNQDNAIPTTDGLDNVRRAVDLTAGMHKIEVAITPDTSGAPAQVRLNWITPEQRQADHDAAIAAAKHARVAVVFAWSRLTPVFGLPGEQDKLVEEVAAVNPNTIVVLNTSQPVALPWLDKVKAVLEMGWPGDEGGWATANILLGKTSPAGRLPMTWARALTDYCATDPKHPERTEKGVDHKTIYTEGVDVGYRWFDREKIEPLFPFGYGLSYTTFAYAGLSVGKAADGGLDVTVTVRNTGKADSDEVPQVYLGAPSEIPADVHFPVRALAAFDRIHLAAGEARQVTLHVAPRQLQYWSVAQKKWVTATGTRTVSVGASSRDLRLSATITE